MTTKMKIILAVAISVVAVVLTFCLIVSIGCAVNGLTFPEQISSWFGSGVPSKEIVDEVVDTVTDPIAMMG